ncbi:hypothetical protein INT48_006959 [Thamnidium elegans]|uniref:G-patch domain-containing protein n=1 Tax=Thamnidium elegans TaxID=101142 RepID=A0A8H7SYG7_9FUNG|nr:hypothetical protein INT48_006959 [Thamnidium elegans]
MSDEEDDYMSLKFLEGAQEFETKRQETYTERRKKQLRIQQEKAYIKPRAQLEQEEREKGLQTSVDESNKGMKMLMKMGFKKGMALGQGGIVEPIKVDLKAGRMGIGMESQLKKRAREEEEEEAKKRVELDPEDYRVLMAQKAKDHQYTKYINAAVSICEKLDEENDVKTNILWTLKPVQPNEVEEEEKEQEDKEKEEEEEKEPIYPQESVDKLKSLSLEHQLEALVSYLRETYTYCFWCRAKYTDKQDLDENCPGTEEDDH